MCQSAQAVVTLLRLYIGRAVSWTTAVEEMLTFLRVMIVCGRRFFWCLSFCVWCIQQSIYCHPPKSTYTSVTNLSEKHIYLLTFFLYNPIHKQNYHTWCSLWKFNWYCGTTNTFKDIQMKWNSKKHDRTRTVHHQHFSYFWTQMLAI